MSGSVILVETADSTPEDYKTMFLSPVSIMRTMFADTKELPVVRAELSLERKRKEALIGENETLKVEKSKYRDAYLEEARKALLLESELNKEKQSTFNKILITGSVSTLVTTILILMVVN